MPGVHAGSRDTDTEAADDAGRPGQHPAGQRPATLARRHAITFTLRDDRLAGQSPSRHLWRINTDGSGLRRLTSNEPGASVRTLVARRLDDRVPCRAAAYSLHAGRAGRPAAALEHETGVADIAWHPNGVSIYFLAIDPATRRRTGAPARARRRRGCSTRPGRGISGRSPWRTGRKRGSRAVHDYIFAYRIAANGSRIIISRRPTPLPVRLGQDRAVEHRRRRHLADPTDEAIPFPKKTASSRRMDRRCSSSRAQIDRQEPYYNANLFLVPATGGQARALMPDFQYEVQRARLGGRRQVDLDGREHGRAQRALPGRSLVAKPQADHERQSCASCLRSGARSRAAMCS